MINDRPVIMVGIDGTPIANRAVLWAVDHAARVGGTVTIVTVQPISYLPSSGIPTPIAQGELPRPDIDVQQQILDTAVEAAVARQPDIPVHGRLEIGVPGETLCRVTRQDSASMLVLGSHGRGPLLRTLLGSVAAYCVQYASCPVLVIPAALDRVPAPA